MSLFVAFLPFFALSVALSGFGDKACFLCFSSSVLRRCRRRFCVVGVAYSSSVLCYARRFCECRFGIALRASSFCRFGEGGIEGGNTGVSPPSFCVVGLTVCVGFAPSSLFSPLLGGWGGCLRSTLLVLLTVVALTPLGGSTLLLWFRILFFVVIVFHSLACVLGVLGVRFLPRVWRSGFLGLCVSVLVVAVVLVVGIRICCLCRSLSALLSVL